ncbi:MAG: S8 family peptidase [Chloroflexi bacterium]|nr:S8 family peptidase [Chloroflexota bacterium]
MPAHPKIHPVLAEILSQTPKAMVAAAPPSVPIIVQHLPRDETTRAVTALSVSSMRHQYNDLLTGQALAATRDSIEMLAARDDVQMIWYDEPVKAILDESVPLIGAPEIYNAGFTGDGVRVGIADTGIDVNHPDFSERIAALRDFTGEGDADLNGHGTHVAGIVGSSGAASIGQYHGVAPDCLLVIAKVLRGDGSGSTSDVIAALEYLVQQQVRVVNLSLGGSRNCDGTDALSVACDATVERGIVVCVAVGNAGPGAGTLGSPACAKKVIAVGATDRQDQVASFSSRGPTVDGRVKPDLCFPGVNIRSTRAAGTNLGAPVDSFYTALSGTSMATPHATGACALLIQSNPLLTPQEIKNALMNTAKDLGVDPNAQGRGRAQVFAAFQSVAKPRITAVAFSPATLNSGDVLNVTIGVQNDTAQTLETQGPEPGLIYEEGETFYTRGFPDVASKYRVGVEFDGRAGIDHPFRWGLGAPLAPGESRLITGDIRLRNAQSRNYWAGFVQERIAWLQDNQGVTRVTVNAPAPTNRPVITAVNFSAQTIKARQVLLVSITVRNDSDATLNTQGPDPNTVYDEGETFYTIGFPDVRGAFRVGIEFDGRAGIDHPYRWGLGAPLAPGQSATITGGIHLKTPATKNYWAGLVQEQIIWLQDFQGTTAIAVS